MLHIQPHLPMAARRGVILMVVLIMLTLFAIVGLSFALYASAESQVAQVSREAEVQPRPDAEPELLASYFLGQLIYDADDVSGVYSALRGHSLARSMYGAYYARTGAADPDIPNTVPFNGMGRLHTRPATAADDQLAFMNPFKLDDYLLPNYTYYPADKYQNPNGPSLLPFAFLRDPERTNPNPTRPQPGSPPPWRTDPGQPPGPFVGGFNAPYTYPDLNNMFLAAVKADGTLLTQSFHRPWLFNSLAENNPNWWASSAGKYMILRPRPVDQLTQAQVAAYNQGVPAALKLPWPLLPERLPAVQQKAVRDLITSLQSRGQLLPYPEDEGGDVKNLAGAPGGNDSIWIDLGFPVMTAPNGQKFKPLFAPLILDLDNRINLNVHGNIRGGTTGARSFVANQGWGPWTVDVSRVLNFTANPMNPPEEWKQLFYGLTLLPPNETRIAPWRPGRYGLNVAPAGTDQSYQSRSPHNYAPIDYDESDNGNPTPRVPLPTGTNCFPVFPAGYKNYVGELANHPSLYNVFRPSLDQRQFPLSDMEALLRFGDTGSPFLTSDLIQLCPNNFSRDPAPGAADQRRRLVTLRSFDVERPGVTPWLTQFHGPGGFTWDGSYSMPYAGATPFTLPPQVPADATLSQRVVQDPNDFQLARVGTTTKVGTDWRSASAALGRLDLNRPLPPYPPPQNGIIADDVAFNAAEVARQQLAQDIYLRLISVTGAYNPFLDPTAHPPQPTDINALRALAQLAVNMVDFIDEDDYSTPFHWGTIGHPNFVRNVEGATGQTPQYVFGVELPRVVINESYAQYFVKTTGGSKTAQVEVWVELYNPLTTDNSQPAWDQGDVDLRRGYRLLLAKPSTTTPSATNPSDNYLRRADNVRGTPRKINAGDQDLIYNQAEPPTPTQGPAIVDFAAASSGPSLTTPIVKTSNGGSGPRGYFVVGADTEGPPMPMGAQVYKRPEMKYEVKSSELVNVGGAGGPSRPVPPTVVLQRLACPYRPHNPMPNDPEAFPRPNDPMRPVNPYITIDYFSDVNKKPGTQFVLDDTNSKTSPTAHPPDGRSEGRRQPYAGHPSQKIVPKPPTFFSSNNGADPNFQWLVHLDRQLTSPMELMHVAAVKPAVLTQEFIRPAAAGGHMTPFNHLVPWYDQDRPPGSTDSHRLYRFLEFVATRSRAAGLQAPVITGQVPNSPGKNQLKVDRLSWLTESGVPAAIKAGDILILDKGKPSHENVRVADPASIALSPTDVRVQLQTPLLKSHDSSITIELTTMGERVPGKININTMWDAATFYALGAATPSHDYDLPPDPTKPPVDTDLIYKQMLALRSPGLSQGQLTQNDRPFLGMASNHYNTNPVMNYPSPAAYGTNGANHTLLGSAQSTGDQRSKRLLQVPFNTDPANPRHPYVANQLLNRLFNNITTRSNVFAVWTTVGFFEVTDDTARPVKLGAEIGKAENRQIRHRFFSIVDRSALTIPSPIGSLQGRITPSAAVQPVKLDRVTNNQIVIGPSPPIGPIDSTLGRTKPQTISWTIRPGDVVVVNHGMPNQETVVVTAVAGTIIRAHFTLPHDIGESVSVHLVPGNPGPIERFNPRDAIYEEVVPYLSIID